MKTQGKDKYKTHRIPSQDEFMSYLQDEMTKEERYQFELSLEEDPFVAEAFEAFERNPLAIKKIINKKNPYKTSWNSTLIGISSFSLLTIIIAFLIIKPFSSTQEVDTLEDIITESEKTSELENSGLNVQNSPNTELVITDHSNQANTDPVEVIPDKPNNELASTHDVIQEFELIPVTKIKNENSNRNISIDHRSESYQILYFHDLKVVNYAPMLSKLHPKQEYNFGGLDSRYENREQASTNRLKGKEDIQPVTYIDFLNESQYLFKMGSLEKALMNYKHILNYNPVDANAYFYSGLVYYEFGDYDTALSHFQWVIDDTVDSFDEEAIWYRALCYERLGLKDKSKSEFIKIIEGQGFYTDKAKRKLKDHD